MKTSLVCLLLAFAVSAVSADDSPLAGKWRVHTSIAGKESDQTCMFGDDNGILSGSCEGDGSESVKITGKFDQMTVSWSYKSNNDDGDSISMQYVGRLDAGRITGVVTIPETGTQGDFIARAAQESGGAPQ